MKKELIDNIQKAYNLLTDADKQTLKLVCILCADIDSSMLITLRSLCDIMGADEQVFREEINTLTKAELLFVQVESMFPPTEVATAMKEITDVTVPVPVLNGCIARLRKALSTRKGELQRIRPFFSIGMSTINYILNDAKEDVDFVELSRLLIQITRHFAVFAQPGMSTTLIQALELVESKNNKKSLLYADILVCHAYVLVNGFQYKQSRSLIDEAEPLAITHKDNDTLACVYFVNALYWENWGVVAKCLENAYKAWEIANEPLKGPVCLYIAYELALIGELELSREWVKKSKEFPQKPTCRFLLNLTEAIQHQQLPELVEDNLMRAECLLNQINHQAPLMARIFYVRYFIYTKYGLDKKASQNYQYFSNLIASQYHSTDGAVCIYAAAEVERFTNIGALVGAKHLIHTTIDHIDLNSSAYSFSVKLALCESYTKYFLAAEFYPLEEVYYSIAKNLIAQNILQAENTLNILRNIFKDGIPASASADSWLWVFEITHLKALIAANRPKEELKTQIDNLMKNFPQHQQELDLISASLFLDQKSAIQAYQLAISSEESKRHEIALQCARLAVAQGLIWEAAEFYNTMLNTDGYRSLNQFEKIDLLLEVAQTLERCGERYKARLIWVQLEGLAKGTCKLADVFQARGNASYDHEQYRECLTYLDKCLTVVQSEDGLVDERLCSLHSYRAASYGALGNYEAAYAEAVQAKQYFPLEEFQAFNVEFNHGVFALFTKRYTEARRVLQHAKALARTKEEKDTVDEQLSVLAMKKEKREAYLKQLLYNFDS